MDVERIVFGWQPMERGDRQRFAAQAAAAQAEAPAILAWCEQGKPDDHYRQRLARIVRTGRATEQDISMLCSAVVRISGTVAAHGQYQGTAQTHLIRCRWTPAKD